MSRISRCVALIAVGAGALALAGCSGPEVTSAEIQEWMAKESHESPASALGSAAALFGPEDVSAEDESAEKGISLNFTKPTRTGGVEFSCFGADSARLVVSITAVASSGTSSFTMTGDPVECAAGPHVVTAADLGVDELDITRIALDAVDAAQHGAWHADVLSAGI